MRYNDSRQQCCTPAAGPVQRDDGSVRGNERAGMVDDIELPSGYLKSPILHLRHEHMNNLSAVYI